MDFKIFNYILIGFSSLITTSLSYFPFQGGPIILDPYGSFFASSELNPFGVQQQKFMHNAHTNGKVQKIYDYYNKPTIKQHKHKYYANPIPKSFNPLNHELLAAEMMYENSKNHELMNIPIKVQPKRKYRKVRIPQYKDYNYQKPVRPTLVANGQRLLHHPMSMKPSPQKNNNNIKNFNRKPVVDGPIRHSRYYKEKYHERPDKITLNGEVRISSDEAAEDDYEDIAKPKKVYHLPPPPKPLPQYEFDEPKMKQNQDNNFFPSDAPNESNRPGFYEIDAPKNLHINAPKMIDANRDRLFEYPKIVHSDDPFFNNKNNEDSLRSRWKLRHEKSKSKINGNNNNLLGIGNREVDASLDVQSDDTDGPNNMMNMMGKVFDDPLTPSKPDKAKLHKTAENYEENYRSQINSQLDDSNPFSYPSPQRDDEPSFVPNSIQSLKPSVKPWVQWPQYQKPNNTRLDLDTNEDHFTNNNYDDNNNKAKEDKSSSNFYNDNNDKEDYEYDDEHSQENSEKPAKAETPLDQTNEAQQGFAVPTLPPPPPDDPIWENPFEKELMNNRQRNNLANDESQGSSGSGGWSTSGIPGQPGKDYPTLQDHPARTRFSCSGKPHGFYSDVNQKCQVYHQCSPQGSQRFVCPNGTLFSQESLVCEWWYNVNCEASEKLYHKNAQLYLPNSDNNKGDNKNKNKENNDREFTPWNHHNSNNNNNNNNYNNNNNNNFNNNNNHHNQQMYNSDQNTNNNYHHMNNNHDTATTTNDHSSNDHNNINYNYDKYKNDNNNNNADGYRNYNSPRNSFKSSSSSPDYHDSSDNEDDSHLSEDIAETINNLFRV